MKSIASVVIALPLAFGFAKGAAFHMHNRTNASLEGRPYQLYVPRSYDGRKPVPLVISIHGAGGWPIQQMDLSRWNEVAEREGFIVVYPSGSQRHGVRVWGERDVPYVGRLIDTIEARYNIDRRRIYANGLSNGGGMSFVLSCTMSDRIAAVGLVGSAQTEPFSWCKDRRAVPMIEFHGTDDRLTPYNGGVSFMFWRPFPNIPIFTANWARRNGCAATPVESRIAADVTRREFQNCKAPVVMYTVEGGGHTWPGGLDTQMPEWFVGRTTKSISATETMWKFFQTQPLASN